MRRALVVFSGRAEMLWQRLLRPGFRHCSLILDDGDDWLLVEPLASYLQIRLRNAGFVVVETQPLPPATRAAPLGLWTCVETVKRGLSIHAVSVQTPWQLFQFLEQNKKISLDTYLK